MATGTPKIYTPKLDALLSSDDWESNTHYAHLFTSYTFGASHAAYSEMGPPTEVVNGDYSQDGLLVGGEAITTDGTKVYLASSALDWGDPVTITAKYLVVFEKATGSLAAGDKPVFYLSLDDSEADVSSTSGAFKVSQHLDGGWLYFEQA